MDAGVPTGAVRTVGDIVDTDPHVADRSMLVDSYNPEADEEVVTPALPFRFSSAIHDGTFSSRPPKKESTRSTSSRRSRTPSVKS